jgi:hypothetical protein
MTDYVATLMHLVPNALVSYTGVEVAYEDIEWLDTRPQPTKAVCDQQWPQVKFELDSAQVERQRRDRYTNETDPMFFQAQRGDGDLTAWNAAVDAIKTSLPYPKAPSGS